MIVLRLLTAVLVSSTLMTACAPEDISCTSELRSYDITVSREISTAFASVSTLSFEACVDSGDSQQCERSVVESGRFRLSNPRSDQNSALLSGTVSATAGGGTLVTATIRVAEGVPDGSTPVSLRASDASGSILLDVAGQVNWDDDRCHPKALNNSL